MITVEGITKIYSTSSVALEILASILMPVSLFRLLDKVVAVRPFTKLLIAEEKPTKVKLKLAIGILPVSKPTKFHFTSSNRDDFSGL